MAPLSARDLANGSK